MADLAEYLRDHVLYEKVMLDFTFQEIQKPHEQLMWNAIFESFGVHARNLYDFHRSDGGGNNRRANQYVSGHKSASLNDFNLLDKFFFHMTKHRATDAKVKLENALKIHQWIETEWSRWVNALGPSYRAVVEGAGAALEPVVQVALQASATNHFTTTNTEISTSAVSRIFISSLPIKTV
jgi:hypothetical protein